MLRRIGLGPSAGAPMPPASNPSYLVVGHVAKDLTPSGPRLGGTAAYAALTARALGYTPALVTACDNDLDLTPLDGLDIAATPSPTSTTFENIYRPEGRRQYLRARAPVLSIACVPSALRSAAIVHVGPIAGEVPTDLVEALASAGNFLGLTPQGWMRRWAGDGQVYPSNWADAFSLLPLASAVVLSLEDLQGDWGVAQSWSQVAKVLVVTLGAGGCTVFAQGQPEKHVPAPEVTEVDPTGAGDVFAAAFFTRLHETQSPSAAAEFANRIAAVSVTRPGLAGIPSAAEARALSADEVRLGSREPAANRARR